MRVIGTAGHVDHGKSTLVEAITGTHPDRLKEEREREMTIDLGFAWLTLPDGEEIGIVDVPGHRDFIENMLAGVGGIDAALFVIAADEGVMPQTREHLAILDILQVQGGVVALSKIDLVDDPDWLDLVEDDIRRVISGTVLDTAPIVRVSARNRVGIPELLETISQALANKPPRPDLGRPRLPVDRVFTIAGFGTVVTGTLSDGRFRVGEEIEVLPGKLKGRIRGLQTHKRKEDVAIPGSRTAVNITGVDHDQIQRGDVIAHPEDFKPTGRMDVQFRLLKDASQPVRHNTEVKLYTGAVEVVARLRLLGIEEMKPGEQGWLQLETKQKVVAVRGDRYILRRPSPGETLGGGVVLDPHPRSRHKRFSKQTLSRLEALALGTPAEILLQALITLQVAPLKEVFLRSNLDQAAASRTIIELLETGKMLSLEEGDHTADISPNDWVISAMYWDQIAASAINTIENYHQVNPLRRGMPREELKSRLKVPARVYNTVIRKLAASHQLREEGPLLCLPGHQISFNPSQQRSVDQLLNRFEASPFSPPSVKECLNDVGEDVYNALNELGLLLQVSPEVVFHREGYEQMVAEINKMFERQETIRAADVRDHFNTSRKYILALLEYLDSVGITVRDGDLRRLKKKSPLP